MNDLYEFLSEVQLSQHHQKFVSKLKVTSVAQLRDVEDEDLVDIGMSQSEIGRLKLHLRRKLPHGGGAFGHLKKFFGKSRESKCEQRFSITEKDSPLSVSSERHVIQKNSVTLSHLLGSGQFGSNVRLGVWTKADRMQVQVAVKCIPKDKLQKPVSDFLQEVSTLFGISHPHLVPIFGVILDIDNILLVMEHAPLQSLVECLKDASLRSSLSVRHLCDLAKQICDGMMYLEQHRLVHGNLAARNILVISIYQVKISDFNLSNAIGVDKKLLENKESVELKHILPWCSPESANSLQFTSASDVWSFGVTLWEMFSYGSQPWSDLSPFEVVGAVSPPSNCRLPKPKTCPDNWYAEMLRCWQYEARDRPKFSDIFSLLSQIKLSRVVVEEDDLPLSTGCIHCKKSDTITVLSKNPGKSPHPGLWLGVVDATNEVGFFNPIITSPHREIIISDVNLQRPTKISRSWSLRASLRPSSRKLTPSMISMPQNDMRHIGHVGFDGVVIGDVPFLSAGQSSSLSAATLSRDLQSSTTSLPVNGNRISLQKPIGGSVSSASIFDSLEENDLSNNEGNGYDFSDLKLPDLSDELNFGGSLYDEVMTALNQALSSRGVAADSSSDASKKTDVTASSSNSTIVAESHSEESEDTDNAEEERSPFCTSEASKGQTKIASRAYESRRIPISNYY